MNDDSFDSRRGILRNEHGKVFGNDCATSGEEARTGLLYAAGWIKRGPTGIIGTNIGDARDTVGSILHDLKKGRIPVGMDASTIDRGTSGRDALAKLLHTRNVQIVDWDGFQRIDEAEKDLKSLRTTSQPREKIVNIAEMLKIARSSQ